MKICKVIKELRFCLLFTIMFGLAAAGQSNSAAPVTVVEDYFDFGHVGIEYKLFHNFKLVNTGTKKIKIDSVNVSCDCSTVRYKNEWIEKGDTLDFVLTFDTRDFYGPVNRKFKIFVSYPEKKTISLIYLSNVGQWMNGLKPNPFSVFFLPTRKKQTVKIPNKFFDETKLELERQFDDSFEIKFIKTTAKKGESLEISLTPNPNLGKGTFLSNFTLKVTTEASDEPTFLTIPVKIVRF